MKNYRFAFTVDVPSSLIVIRYSGRTESVDLHESMVDHLRGFVNAWRYDCIFDLGDYVVTFTDDDSEEIGRIWFELTKGRDVGRRTAIVSNYPAVEARLSGFQSPFPYRDYAFFDTFEAALNWINGLGGATADDAQFI